MKRNSSYRKENQENQILECQYQGGPKISNKEHFQQAKSVVFQELLHQGTHPRKPSKGINDSTSQDVFFLPVLHVDLLGPCNHMNPNIIRMIGRIILVF